MDQPMSHSYEEGKPVDNDQGQYNYQGPCIVDSFFVRASILRINLTATTALPQRFSLFEVLLDGYHNSFRSIYFQ